MSLDNENINRNIHPISKPPSQAAIHKAAKKAASEEKGVAIYYGVSYNHHSQEEREMIEKMKGVVPMGQLPYPNQDDAFGGEDF